MLHFTLPGYSTEVNQHWKVRSIVPLYLVLRDILFLIPSQWWWY